jgi:hypothetical protein
MDIFRLDGNARIDALQRVLGMLKAAKSAGALEGMPTKLTTTHAAVAISIAKGLSIDEVAAECNVSSRSVDRYRHPLAMVVSELQQLYYAHTLDGARSVLAEAVPNAIRTLVAASDAGSITAAKEVLRLGSGPRGDLDLPSPSLELPSVKIVPRQTNPTTQLSNPNPTTTQPPPLPPPPFADNISPVWTAASAKAEEHPSPSPKNIDETPLSLPN